MSTFIHAAGRSNSEIHHATPTSHRCWASVTPDSTPLPRAPPAWCLYKPKSPSSYFYRTTTRGRSPPPRHLFSTVKIGASPSSLYLSPIFCPPPVLDSSLISPEQVTASQLTEAPSPPPAGLFGELPSPHFGKMGSSRLPPPPGADGLLPHCRQHRGGRAAVVAAAMAGVHRAGAMEPREEASSGQGLAGRIGCWPWAQQTANPAVL
jgi:hypothetical protein